MGRIARAEELELKRELLRARSAMLRAQIAHDARALTAPLAVGDQARGALQWLKAHPLVPLAGVALLVAARPRRMLRLALKGYGAWQLWRRARRWWAALTGQHPAHPPR